MKTLIKNGTIITVDDSFRIIKGDVLIEDSLIKAIEKNINSSYDSLIDATDKIVMPGLINCHTHAGMRVFRNTLNGEDLMTWLKEKIWPLEDKMNAEIMYKSVFDSCNEMFKTGTTCFNDMYFETFSALDAINKCKMRCLLSNCLIDTGLSLDARINDLKKLIDLTKNNELVSICVAPHSLYMCGETTLNRTFEVAREYNMPVHIHYCENDTEVSDINKKHNISPIDVLEKHGLLNCKLILAHGVKIDSNDYAKLNKENISIVHNPVSNLALGCGIAPVGEYIKSGLNVCLGTDGQGSSYNLDMFQSMHIASLLNRLTAKDVIKMATINGAKALGIDSKVGSIEVNKCADLIIIDLNTSLFKPFNDILSHIAHNVVPNDVYISMVNGEIIYKSN